MRVYDKLSGDGADQADYRAYRKVDVSSGKDAQEHSSRKDKNVRVLQYDVVHVGRSEKRSGQDLEQNHYRDKNQQHCVVLEQFLYVKRRRFYSIFCHTNLLLFS